MSRWSRVIRLGDYFNEEKFEVKELESYEHFINRLNKILTLKYEQVGKKSSLGFVTCAKYFDATKPILKEFYKQAKVLEDRLPEGYVSPLDVATDWILASNHHEAYDKGVSCVVSMMDKFVEKDYNFLNNYQFQAGKKGIEEVRLDELLSKIKTFGSMIKFEIRYDKKERTLLIDLPMESLGFEALDAEGFSLVFGEWNFNQNTWEYVKNDKLPFIYSYVNKLIRQSELQEIKILIASKDYDGNILFLMENGLFTKGTLIE